MTFTLIGLFNTDVEIIQRWFRRVAERRPGSYNHTAILLLSKASDQSLGVDVQEVRLIHLNEVGSLRHFNPEERPFLNLVGRNDYLMLDFSRNNSGRFEN